MVQSPWNRQGTPQEWKREIISLLKRDDTALCCLTEMVNSKNLIEREVRRSETCRKESNGSKLE